MPASRSAILPLRESLGDVLHPGPPPRRRRAGRGRLHPPRRLSPLRSTRKITKLIRHTTHDERGRGHARTAPRSRPHAQRSPARQRRGFPPCVHGATGQSLVPTRRRAQYGLQQPQYYVTATAVRCSRSPSPSRGAGSDRPAEGNSPLPQGSGDPHRRGVRGAEGGDPAAPSFALRMLFLDRPVRPGCPSGCRGVARSRRRTTASCRRSSRRHGESLRRCRRAVERDPVADLEALAELYRSGALTEVEFEAAKAKLLADDVEPGPRRDVAASPARLGRRRSADAPACVHR